MLQLVMFIGQQDRSELQKRTFGCSINSAFVTHTSSLNETSSKSAKKKHKKRTFKKCPFLVDVVQSLKLELPAFGQFGLDIRAHRVYSIK